MRTNKPNKELIINLLVKLVFLAILIAYLSNIIDNAFFQDDSFTTFRYVKNCLAGNGLVFNTGERVEGYTNFLWTIILCATGKIGIDYVSFAQYLSVLFGAGILILLYFITTYLMERKNNVSKILALIPALLISLNGGFIYWSVSAMETSLFHFLLLLAVFVFIKNYDSVKFYYSFPLLILFASLTRPEGLYYGIILILFEAIDKTLQNGFNSTKLKLFKNIVMLALPLSIYFAWKYFYYGDLLPNTFYAKTGFGEFYLSRGIKYISNVFGNSYYYIISIIALFFLLSRAMRIKSAKILLVLFAANLLNVIIVGGDVLPLNRFLWLSLFIIFISFALFLSELLSFLSNNKQIILSLILMFLIAVYAFNSFNKQELKVKEWRSFELGLVNKMRIYAKWISDYARREKKIPVVAVSTIGAISYYSNATVIDFIGLTDSYIARHPKEVKGIAGNVSVLWKERRYNVDYVLSREPDFIIFPAGLKPSAYPEAAIFSKREFYYNYYPQLIYSEKLDLLLPVYTRVKQLQTGGHINNKTECDINFVENFIRASNYLLVMNKKNGVDVLTKINEHAQKAIQECIGRKDYPLFILGNAYYNIGNYIEAEKYFKEAVLWNPLNTPAIYYLMQINYKQGNNKEAIKYLKKIKEISSSALPGF